MLPQVIEAEWRIIDVGKLTIIGSDNGLSPGRRQTIIWTIAGILLIGPLGTNLSEILIEIDTFSFKKIHLKMSSAKWRPFCLGLDVLKYCTLFGKIIHKLTETINQMYVSYAMCGLIKIQQLFIKTVHSWKACFAIIWNEEI